MIEVYSTNVKSGKQANFLLGQLGKTFPAYTINFDLEDCDNVLRVESGSEVIQINQIIALLNDFGFIAQVLPDSPKFFKESVLMDNTNNSLTAIFN